MQKSTKYKWNIGIGLLVALVYVLIPIDILPDATPAIGWIDDIIAILLAVANALALLSKLRKGENER